MRLMLLTGLLLWIDRIKHILLPIILVAAVVGIFVYLRRRKRQPRGFEVIVSGERVYGAPTLADDHLGEQPRPMTKLNSEPTFANNQHISST